MNAGALLLAAAAGVFVVLGAVHLLLTLRTRKLDPRDPAVRVAMEGTTLVITGETSLWRAVRGFHVTHSLGMIVFGLLYAHLALWQPALLSASPFLSLLGLGVLLVYLGVARRYFFSVPVRGVALACLLYGLGWVLL